MVEAVVAGAAWTHSATRIACTTATRPPAASIRAPSSARRDPRVARAGTRLGEECGMARPDLPEGDQPSLVTASEVGAVPIAAGHTESVRDRVAHLRERAERHESRDRGPARGLGVDRHRARGPRARRPERGRRAGGGGGVPPLHVPGSLCLRHGDRVSGWPRPRPDRIPGDAARSAGIGGLFATRSQHEHPFVGEPAVSRWSSAGSPWPSRRARSSGSCGSCIA